MQSLTRTLVLVRSHLTSDAVVHSVALLLKEVIRCVYTAHIRDVNEPNCSVHFLQSSNRVSNGPVAPKFSERRIKKEASFEHAKGGGGPFDLFRGRSVHVLTLTQLLDRQQWLITQPNGPRR